MIRTLLFCILIFNLSCNQVKYSQGERIYTAKCSNCHMPEGDGLKKLIPSLAKSAYITGRKEAIVSIIHKGFHSDSLGITEKYMPSNKKMKDVELTNLLNYLQEKFNSGKYEYKLEEVIGIRRRC